MTRSENMSPERWEILNLAVATYGPEAQLKMMIEEMSELTKAICKLWRTRPGSPEVFEAEQNILEEAADVQIMLDQIRIIFGDTEEIEGKKVARLLSRLDDHDGKEAQT